MGHDDGVKKLMPPGNWISPLPPLHAALSLNQVPRESVESRAVSAKNGIFLIPFGQAVLGAHRLPVNDANTHLLSAAHSVGKKQGVFTCLA
jgi:cell division FtsZ-interacting protein ZapD